MEILLTGATGYLGTRLAKELIAKGHTVSCICRRTSDLTILKSLPEASVKFIYNDEQSIKTYLNTGQLPECVILSACSYEKGAPDEIIVESNLNFPLLVLRLCIYAGIKKYINIGTSLPESLNLYALTKKQFSDYGKYYSERMPIEFTTLLLENYYGPNEPDNRFIPNCIQNLQQNKALLLTTGLQKRDYVHIEDVLSGILIILEQSLPLYQEFPLGSGEAPSIRELIEYLKNITKSDSTLFFGAVPKRRHEPDSIADLTKLKKLGYQPHYSWQEGMKTLL